MGFDVEGYVLRPARTAPSNATSTGESTTGLLRDHKELPTRFDYYEAGALVEAQADMYRAAVLDRPSLSTDEYLVWAANTSSLTVLETPDWTQGSDDPTNAATIPTGSLTVTNTMGDNPNDGTSRLVVQDTGGRALAQVRLLTIVRGDTRAEIQVGPEAVGGALFDFASQDADAGVVNLSASALSALGGGVSRSRGDSISVVRYIIAAARFWWTRNDASVTRFGWNGITQRWEPYKGSPVTEVGILVEDETYALTPKPSRFAVGNTLPGDPGDSDTYALIRVGLRPDSTAIIPEVQVVSDQVINDGTVNFSSLGNPDAVIGNTNGIVQFNPDFVDIYAGQTIWYNPEQFIPNSNGALGPLLGADLSPLYLSPVPGPTERPFVRLGFRRYLTPVAADTDADLAAATINAGEFGWSRTTGRLKFNILDVAKADPDAVGFDVQYLSNQVYCDGVSLSVRSLSTRAPVQLVDDSGSPETVGAGNTLYIPDAEPVPFPGMSGVLFLPDTTGNAPNSSTAPTTRTNASGLLREVQGSGDMLLFAPGGAIEEIRVVEFESEFPAFPFLIRKGRAYVAREKGTAGSRVALGLKDRARFGGEPMFFLQSEVMPAVYAEEARLYARLTGPYTFFGSESLYFAIDGTKYTWSASTLVPAPDADSGTSYTATEVAASINAIVTGSGSVLSIRDRVVLEAGTPTGSVEIGYGPDLAIGNRDVSGGAVLGLLPGWRVDLTSGDNWLPDNGTTLGVFRSPLNKDRSNTTPDLRARNSFESTLFSESVIASPYFPLNNPPLQDVAGFNANLFFLLVDGFNFRLLENFTDVLYEFGEGRFAWLDQDSISTKMDKVTQILTLGRTGIVPETLHPTLGSFQVSEDGNVFTTQIFGVDYLLPQEGAPGQALLIEKYGALLIEGAAGEFTTGSTTFVDSNATFLTDGVATGYLLHILIGDAAGWYRVTSVTSETELEVEANVPFPVDAGPANGAPFALWQAHTGFDASVYDPALVADVQYEQFNHLPEEPFKMRLLSNLGDASGSLNAVLTESYQRGRDINLRFGQDAGSPTAAMTALVKATELGTMVNGELFVPDIANPHFTNAAFALRVGSKTYEFGTDLTLVASFSPLLGDTIEVLTSTGEIGFGATTLDTLESSTVYYDEEFLPGAALAAGESEYDPLTGDINLASADVSSHSGTNVYFVEQMITEDSTDVVVSPLAGTFYFNRPLRTGQLVEVSYYAADDAGAKLGDEITEFLPVFVQLEEATYVNDFTFSFNLTSRTIATSVSELIWIDSNLQNYGNTTTATLNPATNTISFASAVASTSSVQVNYAVYEAFGGEQAYSTSTLPVYRPPFFLEKEASSFVLETNRTADMIPGKLLRLGAYPYYIQSATYDSGTDATTIEVFPPYTVETGSRAPGNDVLTLLSNVPVTDEVAGVSTGAVTTGFLMEVWDSVGNTGIEYEPVDQGMLSILFKGDVTQFAVGGHLLDIGGYPFLIVGSELAEDGRTTRVDVSNPLSTSFDPQTDSVKISVRTIYPPTPRSFLGINPLVPSEEFQLILFGETDALGTLLPGRTLVQDTHYTITADTGSIELLSPVQGALQPDQQLVLNYTRLKTLYPKVEDGAVIYPRYKASYSFITTPDGENGILGTTLAARYTYRSPDSFYYRVVPLSSYMSEVGKVLISRVSAQNPSGGAVVVSGPSQNNYDYGNLGLVAQRRDLLDQDRAARAFISVYNEAILAFEQVREATNGEVIGDRDGKFRFFIGRGKPYAPPGYEDQITGDLNIRFIWGELFLSANGDFTVTEDDPLVDPETATQDSGTLEVDGDPMDPFVLTFYVDQQKLLVGNDMDDRVLAGLGRPRFALSLPFPQFIQQAEFKSMWEPSRISRLFPELTLAFTTLFPGLKADLANGDPGVYAFLKMLEPPALFKRKDENDAVIGSTFGKTIGTISNPALGVVDNITDVTPRERLPRARVWAYSGEGFPDIDSAQGTTTEGIATIIATPGYLKDFPVDTDTGLPDFNRFVSVGLAGDVPDLVSGDQELSAPGFKEFSDRKPKVKQQINFGRPTGETFVAGNAKQTLKSLFGGGVDIDPVYGGVFVGTVQKGCILTLVDDKGNNLTGQDILALGAGSLEGSPVVLDQGDTVFVVPPGSLDSSEFSDPPTVEEQEEFSKNLPNYRPGFDMIAKRRKGEWGDISLPSFKDPSPFGFKEILGQRPPLPLSSIEADVEFVNTSTNPLQFPALQGQIYNDSGDFSIPYLNTGSTELDRLGNVANAFKKIGQADGPLPTATQAWLAIFPDEIVGTDGSIEATASANPPATLLTARDLVPVNGTYSSNSGVGDVRAYDLLLIETGQGTLPAGTMGILSVGNTPTTAVNGALEVPRFVTQTRRGDLIKYTLQSAMHDITANPANGMVITTTPSGLNLTTTIDISTLGGLFFNDGTSSISINGGLNNIFSANNAIIIRLYQNSGGGSPGALVETLTITGTSAVGGVGTATVVSGPSADEKIIRLVTAGGGGFVSNLGTPFDFTIDIDTYIDTTTDSLLGGASPGIGGGDGSTTARVEDDRLTFSERVDLRTAAPRGTQTAAAVLIEAALAVHEVTAGGTSGVTANAPPEVNNGLGFTIQPRTVGGAIGDFASATLPGDNTELGWVKVNAFESENLDLGGTLSNIVFSAVPSSEIGSQGVILNGVGNIPDGADSTWVQVETANVTGGSVSRAEPGDVLVVSGGAAGDGAIKAGTYLVRHTVPESGATSGVRESVLTYNAGAGGQWMETIFPTITSFDESGLTLTVSDLGSGPVAPDFVAWVVGGGRVYIVVDKADPLSVVSMAYSSLAVGTNTFTLSAGTAEDATGAAITDAAFFTAVATGLSVSGFRFATVGKGFPSPYPSNSIVGYDSGTTTAGGFRHITMSNTNFTGNGAGGPYNVTFSFGGVNDLVVGGAGVGELGVIVLPPSNNRGFLTDEEATVYDDVAQFIDLAGISSSQWESIHGDAAVHGSSTAGVVALLPTDKLVTTDSVGDTGNDDGGTAGFQAIAGVFLEPSFPRPVTDLAASDEKVVDNGTTPPAIAASLIGIRDAASFGGGTGEDVTFEVRRIRRFHAAMDLATANLTPLRYAYEIRRGTATGYSAFRPYGFTLTSASGTQLGNFNDPNVNVNAGDVVRLLDVDGDVVDTAEIASVSATSLLLRSPGFAQVAAVDVGTVYTDFEIYLKTPTVPHEQSNEQLLTLITDQVLYKVSPDYTAGEGGRSDVYNELRDNTGGGVDFTTLGLQVGDILLVDPAGDLAGPTGPASTLERGVRPIGDISTPDRNPGPWIGGEPNELDDNRGWYRIVEINVDSLVVSGVTEFSGEVDADVVFGASGQEYAVYPTVSASTNPNPNGSGSTEGQMDLRPTRAAGADNPDPNSYAGNQFSIEPFGYQVIRPNTLFTEETVNLVLFLRERMLSWLEKISGAITGTKSGNYYVFQRDEHMSDLGTATDPEAGLGVMSNLFITSLSGLIEEAPFANVSDGLSVLDRRYWVLDYRLDTETPTGSGTPYSSFSPDATGGVPGSGRPVLPDRVDDVLNQGQRLRLLRFAWIKFRANRVNGSLQNITRYEAELPERVAEQEELLRVREGLGEV